MVNVRSYVCTTTQDSGSMLSQRDQEIVSVFYSHRAYPTLVLEDVMAILTRSGWILNEVGDESVVHGV